MRPSLWRKYYTDITGYIHEWVMLSSYIISYTLQPITHFCPLQLTLEWVHNWPERPHLPPEAQQAHLILAIFQGDSLPKYDSWGRGEVFFTFQPNKMDGKNVSPCRSVLLRRLQIYRQGRFTTKSMSEWGLESTCQASKDFESARQQVLPTCIIHPLLGATLVRIATTVN